MLGREVLAKVLRETDRAAIAALLAADKKTGPRGEVRMVLLPEIGKWELVEVPQSAWSALLPRWQKGKSP